MDDEKGERQQTSPYYGGDKVYYQKLQCMGIKHCSFAHPELTNFRHGEVTEVWDELLASKKEDFPDIPENIKQARARYSGLMTRWKERTCCQSELEEGKIVFYKVPVKSSPNV